MVETTERDFLLAWQHWRRERDAELTQLFGAECAYYPFDPRWVVAADWEPYEVPRTEVVSSALGLPRMVPVHGALRFTLEGVECQLEPYSSGPPGRLNVAFRDATSGDTTYAAARVIFPPLPPPGSSRVMLDFNRAINPPCAFGPAACAYPPASNTLSVAIAAGEKDVALRG